MAAVTVLIPVGPQPEYLEWLPGAITSALNQTVPAEEILLVGDGIKLSVDSICKEVGLDYWDVHCGTDGVCQYKMMQGRWSFNVWRTPWNIGFAQAFNCGVGLAENDLILYLAADDMLYPTAVEDCLATWEANHRKDAWYALTYRLENGEVHTIPINAAMITRNLWRWMGGFPPSAFAGPDALALSRLMVHAPDRIIKVAEGKPNYWIRQHPSQETGRQASFLLTEMDSIRNKETARFTPNTEVVLR